MTNKEKAEITELCKDVMNLPKKERYITLGFIQCMVNNDGSKRRKNTKESV